LLSVAVTDTNHLLPESCIGTLTIPLSIFQDNLVVDDWFSLTLKKKKVVSDIHLKMILGV